MLWKKVTILACGLVFAAGMANAAVIDLSNSGGVAPGTAVGDGAAWNYSIPSGTFIPNAYADFEVDLDGTYTVNVTGNVFLFSVGSATDFFGDGLSVGPGSLSATLTTGMDYFVYVSAISTSASGSISVDSPASEVPEPSSWMMLLMGVAGIAGLVRRRRKVVMFAAGM